MSDKSKGKEKVKAKTQDDALEAAFVAGTLPEEDRRAPESVAEVAEVEPAAVAADDKEFAAVLGAALEPKPVDVDAIVDAYANLIDSLGVRAERKDGLWHVYRGPGVTSHGAGRKFSRALKAVNSSHGFGPDGKPCVFDESGEILPPEV